MLGNGNTEYHLTFCAMSEHAIRLRSSVHLIHEYISRMERQRSWKVVLWSSASHGNALARNNRCLATAGQHRHCSVFLRNDRQNWRAISPMMRIERSQCSSRSIEGNSSKHKERSMCCRSWKRNDRLFLKLRCNKYSFSSTSLYFQSRKVGF